MCAVYAIKGINTIHAFYGINSKYTFSGIPDIHSHLLVIDGDAIALEVVVPFFEGF
jgi:hypothetical protein